MKLYIGKNKKFNRGYFEDKCIEIVCLSFTEQHFPTFKDSSQVGTFLSASRIFGGFCSSW